MKYVRYHFHSFFHGNPSRARAAAWLFADACAAAVFLGGAVSFCGWLFDVDWMHSGWFKGSPDISPQSAVWFMMTALAMLFIHRAKDTQL